MAQIPFGHGVARAVLLHDEPFTAHAVVITCDSEARVVSAAVYVELSGHCLNPFYCLVGFVRGCHGHVCAALGNSAYILARGHVLNGEFAVGELLDVPQLRCVACVGRGVGELPVFVHAQRLGYALVVLKAGISIHDVVVARLHGVHARCHKVAYGCAQVGAVLCERLVGSAVQNCCLGLFVQAVGCFILGPVGKSRVGAELEPVKLEYRAHAVNKGLQLVARAGGFARGVDLQFGEVEGNARDFRNGEHAGIHLVHVRRAFHHEAQVFERLRHVDYRRLPGYFGYEHVAWKIGVLWGKFGYAHPLVLVSVRCALPECGVVGGEYLDVVGVVVPVGVAPQVLEAERAHRLGEFELQVVITGVGIYAAAQRGQRCHPRFLSCGTRSHFGAPDGVEYGAHVAVDEIGVSAAVVGRQAVRLNLFGYAELRFPYQRRAAVSLFGQCDVGIDCFVVGIILACFVGSGANHGTLHLGSFRGEDKVYLVVEHVGISAPDVERAGPALGFRGRFPRVYARV